MITIRIAILPLALAAAVGARVPSLPRCPKREFWLFAVEIKKRIASVRLVQQKVADDAPASGSTAGATGAKSGWVSDAVSRTNNKTEILAGGMPLLPADKAQSQSVSAKARRQFASRDLLGACNELHIEHNGEIYTLRQTSKGKLILTK